MKLPSGSGAKKSKEYYLAGHLQFLDSFLRSRQSKGNIVIEEKSTQEEPKDSEDENHDGDMDENFDESESGQDTNNSFIDDIPTTPTTAMPPPPPERTRDSGSKKKRKTLDDVNSSACKYFEAKQQVVERRQQSNATSQPDPDMAFLQSVLPDMKAMDNRQKIRFKTGILNLAEEILYGQPVQKAGSSKIAQSKGSSLNNSSIRATELESPMAIVDYTTNGEQFNMQQQIEQEHDFNIQKYLSFLPKSGSLPQN